MGIGGVTYTDGRGRKRNLDVNSLEDFKAQFGAAARTPRQRVTPQLPAPGAAQPQPNAAPDTMPGSAVVNTRSGLALKGEENDPTVPGKKVYGSVDGVKGYHTLDEIDPLAGGGRRVGHDGSVNDASDETPDGDSVQGFDGQGFDVPLASRIALTGGEDGVYTLYQFTRDLRFSSGRRAGGVSAENKKEIGTILVPDGGGGGEDVDFPFKVKNFGTEENPNWGIYLPSHCIRVAGNWAEDSDFEPGLEPLTTEDGTEMSDWCRLNYADGHVYLRIESMYNSEYREMMGAPSTVGDVPHDRKQLVQIVSCSFTDAIGEGGDEDLGTYIDYIEICNIVDGVPYQKVMGAIDVPGPIPEPMADPFSADLTDGAADIVQMRRTGEGRVVISAPIQFVPGSSNVQINHIPPESTLDQVGHRFVISVDNSGGGGGSGDSTEPDNISVDFTGSTGGEIEEGAGGGNGDAVEDGEGGEGGGSDDPTPTPTPQSQKLQIKDWDNDESIDEDNTLADLLAPAAVPAGTENAASQGTSSEGEKYEIVVRKTEDASSPKSLKYLPLGDMGEKFVTLATTQAITGAKTFTNGTKSIVLDPSQIPNSCGGTIGVHKLSFGDGNNNGADYHAMVCSDVNLFFKGVASGTNVVPVNVTFVPGTNGNADAIEFGVQTGTTAGTVAAGDHNHGDTYASKNHLHSEYVALAQLSGFVTLDTEQTITANKVFSNASGTAHIDIVNGNSINGHGDVLNLYGRDKTANLASISDGTQVAFVQSRPDGEVVLRATSNLEAQGNNIALDANNGQARFKSVSATDANMYSIVDVRPSYMQMVHNNGGWINLDARGVKIVSGNAANGGIELNAPVNMTTLANSPTVDKGNTTSKVVATCGWAATNFASKSGTLAASKWVKTSANGHLATTDEQPVLTTTAQNITGAKTFTNGTKSIVLDPSQMSNCSNGTISVHTLEVPRKDSSGNSDVYHILSCSDIVLPKYSDGKDGKDGADGKDGGITVGQTPLPSSVSHPNGGVQITFQPTKGGQSDGSPTVVNLYNGSDGRTPGPFEPVLNSDGMIRYFKNCIVCMERKFLDFGTIPLDIGFDQSGYVVVVVFHPTEPNDNYSASLDILNSLPTNDNDAYTQIAFYHVTNGVIDLDLRAVPTGVVAR